MTITDCLPLPHPDLRVYHVFCVTDHNCYYSVWTQRQKREAGYWCEVTTPHSTYTSRSHATIKDAEQWARKIVQEKYAVFRSIDPDVVYVVD